MPVLCKVGCVHWHETDKLPLQQRRQQTLNCNVGWSPLCKYFHYGQLQAICITSACDKCAEMQTLSSHQRMEPAPAHHGLCPGSVTDFQLPLRKTGPGFPRLHVYGPWRDLGKPEQGNQIYLWDSNMLSFSKGANRLIRKWEAARTERFSATWWVGPANQLWPFLSGPFHGQSVFLRQPHSLLQELHLSCRGWGGRCLLNS